MALFVGVQISPVFDLVADGVGFDFPHGLAVEAGGRRDAFGEVKICVEKRPTDRLNFACRLCF